MATHKDAIKRHTQSLKRRTRNRAYRTQMRTHIRAVRTAIEGGDATVAAGALKSATSLLHKVAGKGVIHRNQAARKISRLAQAVKAMG